MKHRVKIILIAGHILLNVEAATMAFLFPNYYDAWFGWLNCLIATVAFHIVALQRDALFRIAETAVDGYERAVEASSNLAKELQDSNTDTDGDEWKKG